MMRRTWRRARMVERRLVGRWGLAATPAIAFGFLLAGLGLCAPVGSAYQSPSYRVAFAVCPRPGWGCLFIVSSLLVLTARQPNVRCAIFGGVLLAYALMLGMAAPGKGASLGGWGIILGAALAVLGENAHGHRDDVDLSELAAAVRLLPPPEADDS